MKTVHIINPAAGQGGALNYKDCENVYITKGPGDGRDYVEKLLEEEKEEINFAVCGGDGTVNEVVSGIVRSGNRNCGISVLPVGTGNDLIRSISKKGADAIDVLTVNDGYAVNAVNTGFDLEVVIKAAQFKKKPLVSGTLAYILGVVSVFTKKIGKKLHIEYTDSHGEDHSFDGECLLAVAANGNYYGGGFMASPAADLTDGYIDLLIVRKISRLKFLSLVLAYKSGKHIDRETKTVNRKFRDVVIYSKCQKAVFDGIDKLCTDGEVFEQNRAEIGILPSALKIYSDREKIKV